MHLPRTALAGLLAVAGLAAAAGPATAVHWPQFGGDNGRSGYQPVDEGAAPVTSVYAKTADTEKFIKTSIVTSAGSPATQRLAFGTRDGFVHQQVLGTGAPVGAEEGVDVLEAEESDAARDVFGTRSTVPGENGGSVSFADTSSPAGLGQLYVVHNDDDDAPGGPDIEIAKIDEASGTRTSADADVTGTDGFTVDSSLLATGPAADGSRVLFFVASRDTDRTDARLFRVAVTGDARTSSAVVAGASATSTADIDASPLASPTLAFFDVAGTPTPHVVVGTQGAVRSFRVSDLSAGPSFSAPGQSFQTPSVPVQPDGMTPNPGGAVKTAPRVYVAADDGTSTTVHALRLSGGAFQQYATRTLAGRPAPALAVEQESEPTLAEAKLVVTTGANLYLLETGALAPAGQLSDVALTAGTTGFRQTTATASGELGYVTRDNADQVVFRILDGKAVTPAEFTSAAPAGMPNTGVGQPSVSRGFVQFAGGNGAFVYRNRDVTKPTVTLTGPADGATVSGTSTSLSAQAFDARGITKVDFRLDGQVVRTDTTPDSGSPFGAPGATYTVTIDTTTLSNGSKVVDAVATDGGGLTTTSATRRITVQNAPAAAPSASPSPSVSPAPRCDTPARVDLERTTIVATGSSGVTVTAPAGSTVDLLAYTRPSTTYRVVRSGSTGASGSVAFTALRPPANTRLYAQVRGCPVDISRDSVVLNVRTALSLNVTRRGVRSYTFSGDSLPARPGGLIISLYRTTSSGREVLTSQTRASATTGDWVIDRTFTCTGRFGFVVRTGQDLQNAPGASNVRSLLVF